MSKENATRKPSLIAYAVTQSGEKSYFHRIGAGWKTKKDGIKVMLDALPVSGELMLFPPREAGEADAANPAGD